MVIRGVAKKKPDYRQNAFVSTYTGDLSAFALEVLPPEQDALVHPLPPRAEALLKHLGLEAFQDAGHSDLEVLDRLEVGSLDDILYIRKSQKSQGAMSRE